MNFDWIELGFINSFDWRVEWFNGTSILTFKSNLVQLELKINGIYVEMNFNFDIYIKCNSIVISWN